MNTKRGDNLRGSAAKWLRSHEGFLYENRLSSSIVMGTTISAMSRLIESRDVTRGDQDSHISDFVGTLAENARRDGVYTQTLDDGFIAKLRMMAPMHDIGKIAVSDRILTKPGKLTAEEFECVKRHAAEGGRIVREVLGGVADSDYLAMAEEIAACHHERWDGKGYPAGLAGEDIPLSARIMAIADVFDALVSERCYKMAMPAEKACAIIREESGTHFDPSLVHVFLKHSATFIGDGSAAKASSSAIP